MSRDDREAIVATVEETYALMGRALNTGVPTDLMPTAIRPDVMLRISEADIDPYVTDQEMLELLRAAYFDLVEALLRIHEELLLRPDSERYDPDLANVALTGNGRAVKVGGFRRALGQALENVPGLRWVKKAFEWGNIILGSLGAVPVVGVLADPIRELKESIEAQGEDDQTSPSPLSW
jgi:hypothetical protein